MRRTVHASRCAALLVLLILATGSYSYAEETEISSDTLRAKGPLLELEGSVVLKRGDAVVRADSAIYNTATGDISAEGNIRYEDPDVVITAAKTEVNLKTEQGVLHGASAVFKRDSYRFEGTEIHKYGPDRYSIRSGSATTCEGIPPAWCFRGRDIDVYVGERIRAKHVTFRVKNVPVFYTPYLWAPIITERRTGLLTPTVGYRDSTGFYYKQPFFWAMAENRDATLFVDHYSRRALGQGLEYRYIEGPGIEGSVDLYHLRDSMRDRDFFEAKAGHRHQGRHISGFLDLNYVNFREFYRVYEDRVEESSLRFLESGAEVYGRKGNSRLYLLGRYYQDLKDGVDKDTVLQRLPEMGIFYAPGNLGPFVIRGTASAAMFRRDKGTEGERYGIDLRGTHSAGRTGRGPTLTQTIGAQQTFYDTGDKLLEKRTDNFAYDYSGTLLSAFERDYGPSRHSIEAELGYRYFNREGEPPPFFDSVELMGKTSVASASLINRVIGSGGEFITLKVSQSFDFLDDDRPFMPLEADIAIRRPLFLTAKAAYDHYESHVNTVNSNVRVHLGKTEMAASYDYSRDTDIEVYAVTVRQGIFKSLELSAGARYDDAEEEGFEELTAGVKYTSQCWGVELSVLSKPEDEDFSAYVKINLLGLGDFGGE